MFIICNLTQKDHPTSYLDGGQKVTGNSAQILKLVTEYFQNLLSSQLLSKYFGLGVFENRVLRRIFGPKRDEVTGECRKLHNEELNDLYSSPTIIIIIKARKMRWVGHVARTGEKRNAYRFLVGKPEGRRLLGRPRRRWLDNIRMDLVEVG
jgi:hypothetical protein